jgi:uncharacterized protein
MVPSPQTELPAAAVSADGAVQVRTWEQWVPHSPQALWPFCCDPKHLEEITPPFLRFRVLGMSTPVIEAGTRIDYRLRLKGVPFAWQTLIEHWEPPQRFVDTQARGPYALWHHTHEFVPQGRGTLMRDTVRYRLPLGAFGRWVAGGMVARDVERIFAYRARALQARFGQPRGAQ